MKWKSMQLKIYSVFLYILKFLNFLFSQCMQLKWIYLNLIQSSKTKKKKQVYKMSDNLIFVIHNNQIWTSFLTDVVMASSRWQISSFQNLTTLRPNEVFPVSSFLIAHLLKKTISTPWHVLKYEYILVYNLSLSVIL